MCKLSIGLQRLQVSALIGVYAHEKIAPQPLLLSIAITCAPPFKDDLTDTIDYAEIRECCHRVCMEKPRDLIETLAQDLADTIKKQFSIQKISVRIEKPHIFADVDCAFVLYEE